MRAALLASLLIATMSFAAAPGFAQSPAQNGDRLRDGDQPRGEHWDDRWRGRHHIVDDDVRQDRTDGLATQARPDCRAFAMRVRRPDGSTAVRHENRCD